MRMHETPAAGAGNDTGGPAVLILDSAGQIVDCSPAAEAMLGAGTHIVRNFGRLATCGGGQLQIEALGARARLNGAARHRLCRDTELEAVRLYGHADGDRLLVIVHTRAAEEVRKLQRAVVSYRLTGAEHRLLAILFEGCALPEAAARLGIARTTARSHLQHIFDKTGARRQAELLRTIALAS